MVSRYSRFLFLFAAFSGILLIPTRCRTIFSQPAIASLRLHAPGTPVPPHRGIPELRWNQFGGSLGGPIKKDRLFFFGDYQGTYRRIGASQSIRVPTAAERAGDLSDLGVTIYNPFTGNPNGTGRAPFAGSAIPTGLIPAPITKLLAALPLPNFTPVSPTANNYAANTVENYNTNQFDVRSDYLQSHSAFRYSHWDVSSDRADFHGAQHDVRCAYHVLSGAGAKPFPLVP